jgi:hypothetical protein
VTQGRPITETISDYEILKMPEEMADQEVMVMNEDNMTETSAKTTSPDKLKDRLPYRSPKVRVGDVHDKRHGQRTVCLAYVVDGFDKETSTAVVNFAAAIFKPPGKFKRNAHHATARRRLEVRPHYHVPFENVNSFRDLELKMRKYVHRHGVGGRRIKYNNKKSSAPTGGTAGRVLTEKEYASIRENLRQEFDPTKPEQVYVADLVDNFRIVTIAYKVKAVETDGIVVSFAAAVFRGPGVWCKKGHHQTARRRLEKNPHRYVTFFLSSLLYDRATLERAMRYFLHHHGVQSKTRQL